MDLSHEWKISTEYDGKTRRVWPKKCEQCNEIFYAPKHRLDKRKYCSIKCQADANKNRYEVECAMCSKKFERVENKLSTKTGLNYCSRKCKDKAQSTDGIFEARVPHFKDGYHNCRERTIKERKICEVCGYKNDIKMLDVHHKDRNRKNNLDSNLKVLCVWCHALETRKVEWHAWNGKI
jgi:hypothetical protein